MKNKILSFRDIFEIIQKTVSIKRNIFVAFHRKKNISKEDVQRITDFTIKETTETQRMLIRVRIETLFLTSFISESVMCRMAEIEDFKDFLMESLSLSVSNPTKVAPPQRLAPILKSRVGSVLYARSLR